LLLFVVGIGANLARGHKPECHCFGQLHSAPAGWKTLTRNGALAAVAGFVVWQGWSGEVGPSAIAWLGPLSAVQLLILVGSVVVLSLLAGQWWFLLHLLRQNGRLLVRIEALEQDHFVGNGSPASPNGAPTWQAAGQLAVGTSAPAFSLEDLHGETLTLDSLRKAGNPVVLLFTDPGCGPCNVLLPDVGRWQADYHDKLSIALVSRGDPEENRTKAQEHGLTNVVLQDDWEVSEAYDVAGTPGAVLVSAEGTIASPMAGGAEAIRALVAQAAAAPTHLPVLPRAPAPTPAQEQPCPNCGKVHAAPTVAAAEKIGEPAPEVKLPDLEGNDVELEHFRGEQTLLLFWNPECGFCQQMLPEIKQWEASRPEGAPKPLFVSAGTEETNREMGLASTVVLDQQFAVGRAFGASGTPSAVLLDAEGKIASGVAVGAPAVLGLAGANRTEA
jgi:peroxiredoxin